MSPIETRVGSRTKWISPQESSKGFCEDSRTPSGLLGSFHLGRRRRLSDTSGGPMSLDSQTKEKIYSRVCGLVTRKHFDPGMNGANWEELSKARRDQILRSTSDEEFEKQIQDLLSEL